MAYLLNTRTCEFKYMQTTGDSSSIVRMLFTGLILVHCLQLITS